MSADKVTILVVDDSDIIRYSLKNFFGGFNFEVISCLNGLEGIQKAQEYIPDLIFLDLMMPNVNGLEMLRYIKTDKRLKKIPVIIISGNTSKENVLAVVEAGADRIISKPLRKEVIIKTIKGLLGEDFLTKTVTPSEAERSDKEFTDELRKVFLEEYPGKKQIIIESLGNKNKALLSGIAHELKSVGEPIGYPIIGEIFRNIETTLKADDIDWDEIKTKCEQFFSVVDKFESIQSSE
jgi:CheY-like chemotaxis protein